MNLKTVATILAAAILIVFAIATYDEPEFDEPVSYSRHVAECTGSATYTEVASVVSAADGNVTVKTEAGTLLAFLGDGFEVGDNVELLIDANDATDDKDDAIIDAMLL